MIRYQHGCTDKTLYVLTGASSGVSFGSFTTFIRSPDKIASASISLGFLISYLIVKTFLKTLRKKEIYTERFPYWLEAN